MIEVDIVVVVTTIICTSPQLLNSKFCQLYSLMVLHSNKNNASPNILSLKKNAFAQAFPHLLFDELS